MALLQSLSELDQKIIKFNNYLNKKNREKNLIFMNSFLLGKGLGKENFFSFWDLYLRLNASAKQKSRDETFYLNKIVALNQAEIVLSYFSPTFSHLKQYQSYNKSFFANLEYLSNIVEAKREFYFFILHLTSFLEEERKDFIRNFVLNNFEGKKQSYQDFFHAEEQINLTRPTYALNYILLRSGHTQGLDYFRKNRGLFSKKDQSYYLALLKVRGEANRLISSDKKIKDSVFNFIYYSEKEKKIESLKKILGKLPSTDWVIGQLLNLEGIQLEDAFWWLLI